MAVCCLQTALRILRSRQVRVEAELPRKKERVVMHRIWKSGWRAALVVMLPVVAYGLTRWSTNHIIPDADFIEAGNVVAEYQGYLSAVDSPNIDYKNIGMARFGFGGWADVQAGYAGAFTLAFKLKILGEQPSSWAPSVAIGVHDIFHHREDDYYGHAKELWKPEYFIALGKSVEPIRLRLNLGCQIMPDVPAEKFDCFFGAEKYLGGNVYATLETYYRDRSLRPSLFGTWRIFKENLELSIGAVDLKSIFFNDRDKFALSFVNPQRSGLVRPGLWFGVRFKFDAGINSGAYAGFGSVEEQLDVQRGIIKTLRHDVDSLRREMSGYATRLDTLDTTFTRIADHAVTSGDHDRLKARALETIAHLTTMYSQDNFDASKIKPLTREIVKFGDLIVPILKEVALDNSLGRRTRSQAAMLLGEIVTEQSGDALLDLLAQTQDPDVKIEGIIAIGKLRDRRAIYLLQQLAGDPNESVAFAASEVLHKLGKKAARKDTLAAPPAPAALPEKKIRAANNAAFQTEKVVNLAPSGNKKTAAPDSSVTDSVKKTSAAPTDSIDLGQALFSTGKATVSDSGKVGRTTAPAISPAVKPIPPKEPKKPMAPTSVNAAKSEAPKK
jgi:hypothetical protein